MRGKKIVKIGVGFLIINLILIMFNLIIFNLLGAKIITLSLKSNKSDTIQFFYVTEDNKEFDELNSSLIKYEPENKMTKLRNLIFTKDISKFRVDLGTMPSNYEIKYLSILDSLFSKQVWSKDNLMRDFNSNQQIEIHETNNDTLKLETLGNDGFVSGDNIKGQTAINTYIILLEIILILFLVIIFNIKEIIKYCSQIIDSKIRKHEINVKEPIDGLILEFHNIIKYITKNKYIVYISIFFTVLSHGVALSYYKMSIDSEISITKYEQGFNAEAWVRDGRFGIGLIKSIFKTGTITVPTYNILLALTMLVLFMILSIYIINKYCEKENKLANIGFLIMFISFSQIPTYMTFVMYSFEVSVGYLIVALSILYLSRAILDESNFLDMILGIILLMFAISIYQSFITLYVCFVCVIGLISNKKKTIADEIKNISKFILVLIVSIVIYFSINLILTSSIINGDGYLGGFIGWKRYDVLTVISIIVNSIKSIIFQNKLYGAEILKIAYIILLVILVLTLVKKKIFNSLYLIGFMISPFLLFVALGSEQPLRSLVTLPFFVGIFSYSIILMFKNKNVRNFIFIGIFLIGMYQSQFTSRLYFGDYMRYEQDVQLGNRIAEKIDELGLGEYPKYPVVYVGLHSSEDKILVLRNEVIGNSFFEWDNGNVYRIRHFMNIIGHDYKSPSKEDIKTAYEVSHAMNAWPYSESVKFENNVIVVKLSEPTEEWRKIYEVD